MSYIECTQCGHKALSVASRCPSCGFEFPPRPLHRPMPEPRLDRRRAWLAVGGALVAGAVVMAALLHRSGTRPADAGPGSVAAPADTTVSGAAGVAGPDTGSAGPATGSARPAAPASRPAMPRAGVTRYARTWINVREGRASATRSVRVLTPGEAVVVDSLRRGWYRVLADGRTLGYVHRSNLDTVRHHPSP